MVGPVVIAEAVKFNAAEIVVILLLIFGSILIAASVMGVLGTAIGVALARRSQSPADRLALRRCSKFLVALGALGATAVSWIVLTMATTAWPGAPMRPWLVFLGGIPLPIVWGWWLARTYRFGNAPRPSAATPPPPNPPDPTSPPETRR